MPVTDVSATTSQLHDAETMRERVRLAADEAHALEQIRVDARRVWTDPDGGVEWTYAALGDAGLRIDSCADAGKRLKVPSVIDGVPVVAIHADACRGLKGVEEVVCPDSVQKIGSCAFRDCPDLRILRLPRQLSDFDSSWFRHCPRLEELELPGLLARLDPSIFEVSSLKVLRIGAGTSGLVPGTFSKSKLERVAIDSENEELETDGAAIYTKSKKTLVALAVPCSAYAVDSACTALAEKAFSSFIALSDIELPDTIISLGAFSMARTSIASFTAPHSLREIGEKAFYRCRALSEVKLCTAPVERIGDGAFSSTGIASLRLPATLRELGKALVDNTPLTFGGEDATFTIEPGSPFEISDAGGLYRCCDDGLHFSQLLDAQVRRYELRDETVAVDARAFAHRERLEEVVVPAGVRSIGRAAFKGCYALRRVNIPDSVREIGDEAFLDSSIECLALPASLERVGHLAFITRGAHHGRMAPALQEVSVGCGSRRFFVESGLLCERCDDGAVRVLVRAPMTDVVVFPPATRSIASYALNGARGIRDLAISDAVTDVEVCGLNVDCFIEHLHIDLSAPIDGHDCLDIYFPDTERSRHEISLALGTSGFVDVQSIMSHYDDAVGNVHDAGEGTRATLAVSLYEQMRRIVARMKDPVLLQPRYAQVYASILGAGIEGVCTEIARHDDRALLEDLADLGYLNAENLTRAVEAVGRLQDAAMTAYLLDLKRRRFAHAAPDFAL